MHEFSAQKVLLNTPLTLAVISHCLATIADVRYRNLDADHAALIRYVSRCLRRLSPETCLPL